LCVFAVFSFVSYPVVSWSCADKNAVGGAALFPGFFSDQCQKDYYGQCHAISNAVTSYSYESENFAPCSEMGDILMFCSSFYSAVVKSSTKGSMGFFDNTVEVKPFTSGGYSRFCVPTAPSGNNESSNILIMGLEGIEGGASISEFDTVLSPIHVLPLPRKEVEDTKLGRLLSSESLDKDGTYNYGFNVREISSADTFSRALGRIESMNASLRIGNAIWVPRGGYVQFNHCDQLKYIEPGTVPTIHVIQIKGGAVGPSLLQSSKDGKTWTTFAQLEKTGSDEVLHSVPDPTQCHIRYAYESEPQDPDELNAWSLLKYGIEFKVTEKPDFKTYGAQIAYYQGFKSYDSHIDFIPEFIADPFVYDIKKGGKLVFPIVLSAYTEGSYYLKVPMVGNCGSISIDQPYGPLSGGISHYANITFTINDEICFIYGDDFTFNINVDMGGMNVAQLVVQISGKGISTTDSSSNGSGGGGSGETSETSGSHRWGSASHHGLGIATILLALVFSLLIL